MAPNNNTLHSTIIPNPGKFEGEARYVPYYWEQALRGCADEEHQTTTGRLISIFHINADDHALYPELRIGSTLTLHDDEQGFVYGHID